MAHHITLIGDHCALELFLFTARFDRNSFFEPYHFMGRQLQRPCPACGLHPRVRQLPLGLSCQFIAKNLVATRVEWTG